MNFDIRNDVPLPEPDGQAPRGPKLNPIDVEAVTGIKSGLYANPLEAAKALAPKYRPNVGIVLTTTGKTPISGFTKGKAGLEAAIAKADDGKTLPEWRVHDIRRTVATGFQRLGIRFEVTEAVLNHVSGAKAGVAGIYQRHDWASEKRDALNAWARHIEQHLTAANRSNVVRLKGLGA